MPVYEPVVTTMSGVTAIAARCRVIDEPREQAARIAGRVGGRQFDDIASVEIEAQRRRRQTENRRDTA